MAGGIDWFRWHHGTVTDPKFRVVARKAGARVGDVLAVWALILERSSASDNRGHPGALDMETVEEAFGLADGDAQRIYDAMVARGLIDASTGRIVRWGARQPKREDNSTERSRQHRERKRQASQDAASPDVGNAVQRTATRGNARGEEGREEEIGASIPAEHDPPASEPASSAPLPLSPPEPVRVAPGVAGMLCRRLKAMGIRRITKPNGTLLLPHELDADTAAAIKSFEIDKDGAIKYVFWDKNSAMERLFKHKGLFELDNKQKADPLADLLGALKGNVVGPVAQEGKG